MIEHGLACRIRVKTLLRSDLGPADTLQRSSGTFFRLQMHVEPCEYAGEIMCSACSVCRYVCYTYEWVCTLVYMRVCAYMCECMCVCV